nr:ribonuclease H-like domain-containing protein [Tanacetum cinerariifolium]
MFLSQRKYAAEILERAHMANCNPNRTPVNTESKLGDDGDLVSDPTFYRSLACSLWYLTFTRRDISYEVQQRLNSGYCVFLGNNLLSWSSKSQPTLSRSNAEASDSEDINEGLSKGKVPKQDINEDPSKRKLPPLGSSARPRPEVGPVLAKLFNLEKETKDKSSMDTFSGSTDEESSDNETTVGTTCKDLLFSEDTIEKKRPPGNFADKGNGKAKV